MPPIVVVYARPGQVVRAFTLVEVLVVIAIALILIGITTPVLILGKNRSYDSLESSAMHQFGLAASLYEEMFERPAFGLQPLVGQGLVPKVLCVSPRDRTVDGLANTVVASLAQRSRLYEPLRPPFRNSYLGLYELNYSGMYFTRFVEGRPGSGWLIALSGSKSVPPAYDALGPFKGGYLRLFFDGSVHFRPHHEPIDLPDGHSRNWIPLTMFLDADDQWVNDFSQL